MGRLMDLLRRPIAGIPAWGWALVIAGTVVAYAWIQRLREGDGPKVAPETLPYPDGQSPSDAGDVPGVPVVTPNDVTVTTNPAWVRVVTDRLVAGGAYSPVDVANALNKVLSGLEVTAQEAAIWNEAVRRFGAPPEGNPPILVKPAPTTPTPTTPTPTTPKPPASAQYVDVGVGFKLADLPAWVYKYRKFRPTIAQIEALNGARLYNVLVNRKTGRFVKPGRVRVR